MTLRAPVPAEHAALLALVRDEAVAASLSTAAPVILEEALRAGEALAVEDGGELVGVVCRRTHNVRSRIAGIHTLAIDPRHRGRGLAVRALRELVRVLLDEEGFHRVEAETYGFNAAARRTFLAAGFTEEGVRRRAYDRHGEWQDGIHFGLLAEDAPARPGIMHA